MDFSGLSNDELADAGKDLFDEAHARIDALDASPARSLYESLFNKAHLRMNTFLGAAKTGGTIHPDSGGSDKGDGS